MQDIRVHAVKAWTEQHIWKVKTQNDEVEKH